MNKNRQATFKVPPVVRSESQESRRKKALDEQKRKRAQRVDSSRQLDLFADLSLGQSDDEAEAEDPGVVRMGIASYAPLLPPSTSESKTSASNIAVNSVSGQEPPLVEPKKKKRKQKSKKKSFATPSKWADHCMYAELLEMSEDDPWTISESSTDGLPADLETGWVAVAPVPVGKRCLAVTDTSLGVPGLVPNTCLRSRKLGKLLLPRFPSALPPLTILDCILDSNWRENGILHILDVVKWKGQDIGDCETPFRFWWRDTRLGELSPSPPPSSSHYNPPFDPTDPKQTYRFPYPTKLLAVPYHTDTSLLALVSQIIPLARASRSVDVEVPVLGNDAGATESMAVDQPTAVRTTRTAEVGADGLLLYVTEACYEAGTSPLSTWIPITKYEEANTMTDPVNATDGPLDLFHRLVQKRITRNASKETNPPVMNSSLQMDVETL
ncbi:hypothetical protein C8F04DRAFT_1105436 [Mycena alexandri]|uniref:Snurportin-1 n=1 Tax=Mycena alexandri TaxID=1745969 RepID=A0AAD6X5S4_9AGAR|nr:hypothetical protein C8F04DRAFT_1105436 [Mycena alexandri]